MIHINNYDISEVYAGPKKIVAVYNGLKLVWSKITNLKYCYANGYWIDEYPWNDNSHWTD